MYFNNRTSDRETDFYEVYLRILSRQWTRLRKTTWQDYNVEYKKDHF